MWANILNKICAFIKQNTICTRGMLMCSFGLICSRLLRGPIACLHLTQRWALENPQMMLNDAYATHTHKKSKITRPHIAESSRDIKYVVFQMNVQTQTNLKPGWSTKHMEWSARS